MSFFSDWKLLGYVATCLYIFIRITMRWSNQESSLKGIGTLCPCNVSAISGEECPTAQKRKWRKFSFSMNYLFLRINYNCIDARWMHTKESHSHDNNSLTLSKQCIKQKNITACAKGQLVNGKLSSTKIYSFLLRWFSQCCCLEDRALYSIIIFQDFENFSV